MEIKDALQKMNSLDQNQWNTDGTAKLAAVRAIAGNNAITRDDIAKAAPDFSKDNPFINEEVVKDNRKALAELVTETSEALDESRVRLTVAQAEHTQLTKKLDQFKEEDAKLNPAPSTTQTMQGYLKRQRQELAEKGERLRRVKESGIDLKELSKLIN